MLEADGASAGRPGSAGARARLAVRTKHREKPSAGRHVPPRVGEAERTNTAEAGSRGVGSREASSWPDSRARGGVSPQDRAPGLLSFFGSISLVLPLTCQTRVPLLAPGPRHTSWNRPPSRRSRSPQATHAGGVAHRPRRIAPEPARRGHQRRLAARPARAWTDGPGLLRSSAIAAKSRPSNRVFASQQPVVSSAASIDLTPFPAPQRHEAAEEERLKNISLQKTPLEAATQYGSARLAPLVPLSSSTKPLPQRVGSRLARGGEEEVSEEPLVRDSIISIALLPSFGTIAPTRRRISDWRRRVRLGRSGAPGDPALPDLRETGLRSACMRDCAPPDRNRWSQQSHQRRQTTRHFIFQRDQAHARVGDSAPPDAAIRSPVLRGYSRAVRACASMREEDESDAEADLRAGRRRLSSRHKDGRCANSASTSPSSRSP